MKTPSMENFYRLDRTQFSILSFSQADNDFNNHHELDWQERFRIHQYLNSITYGYANSEPPIMDKTIFSYRKIDDGKYLLS